MAWDPAATLNVLESHALVSGWFRAVNTHEPKNAPSTGTSLALAIWLQQLTPVPPGSGLAETSARGEWSARLYANMLTEPQDAIDTGMMQAAVDLMTRISGDFTLGGNVRNVDLLGAAGPPLGFRAGYLDQDGRKFRVITITVPCIVNDLFAQAE